MTPRLLLIASVVVTTLAGCGTKQTIQSVTFPTPGTVATRSVGEELISQGTGIVVPDIEILSDTTIGNHRLPKGRYDYYDANATGTWFIRGNEYFHMRKSDGHICIDKTKECAAAPYKLHEKLGSLSENAFQQTLLYNGKIGNRITLGYREFSNDRARPAFNNEVNYDLSESTIVGYKGVRLEVVKATNTEITYKILSGFAN